MQENHLLEVQNGDALGALRATLTAWWDQYLPRALLAPVEDPDDATIITKVIEDRADLARVNPFAPLMTCNAAGTLDQLIQEHPNERLGAILRPCEMRTYTELRKRKDASGARSLEEFDDSGKGRLAIFGVDCLGTYSQDDYRVALAKGGQNELVRETLYNAFAGGFRMGRYRLACQVCDWPAPWGADVVIGTIGVDTDRYLLILSHDGVHDFSTNGGVPPDHPAVEKQVNHRETIIGAVADAHAGVRKNLLGNAPSHHRLDDLGSLLGWLATCSLCGDCLEACPLYFGAPKSPSSVDRTQTTNDLSTATGLFTAAGLPTGAGISTAALTSLVLTSRWLASCTGCGMCEESCQGSVPLTLLLSALSHRIREETDYIAGNPAQSPPWAGD